MISSTFTAVETASLFAAVLIAGVAAFQVALALGLPLGGAVFGGRAPTEDGVLTARFRGLALVQAVVLLLIGWILLARTAVVAIPLLSSETLVWLTWVIVAFLALNTVANYSAPHPVERWLMGSITLTVLALGLFVALSGADAH